METNEKKSKIKTIDTDIGIKFIVGLEETKKIEPIKSTPVTYIEDIVEQENEEASTNLSKTKVSYSYGYINYIWYGIISVGAALVILIMLLKK